MPPPSATPRRAPADPRRRAMEIITHALGGRAFAQNLLDESAREAALSEPDRRLLMELVYGVIKHMATLDAVLAALSSRPLAEIDPALLQVLRLGAYQILFMDRIPPHAAVNESVSLARSTGHAAGAGFVNAVLRRMLRSAQPSPDPQGPPTHRVPLDDLSWVTFPVPVLPDEDNVAAHLAAAYSYPEWIVERWVRRFGRETAVGLMRLANRPAATFVRPNTLRTTIDQLAAEFASQGLEAVRIAGGRTLRLPPGVSPAALPAFHRAWMTPQDETAAAVAPFVDPRPGESVLDLCAAPGGKTCHMAELMRDEGRIIAVDVNPSRLRRLRENVKRLGLRIVQCVEADGVRFASERPRKFDAVLVDAPCSNTGVLRRRPEARWRLNAAALAELAERQRSLLLAGAAAVRPGGRLVYSTCSLEPEENSGVVRACSDPAGMELEDERCVLPSEEGDGGYMARLRRPPAGGA